MAPQTIRLRVADVAARHLEVEHTVHGVAGDRVVLRMPTWCPGSYLVRDYAGHVSRFAARSGDDALAHTKTDKTTWEVTVPGGGDVTVVYRVFAPELTVRTNDLSHDHAFVHPPATFMAVDGRTDETIDLVVDAPEGWNVSTALPLEAGILRARDVDHLFDSPLEIGPHEVHSFRTHGRRHDFVVHGSGNVDIERVLADTEKIVAAELDFFGGEPPYDHYVFILHLLAKGGGGLEHDDSCVLAWPKLGFRPEKKYRKFLTLVAHEFLHVWHVRRTRPEALVHYDYFHEAHTRLLWVFEGFTNYYDELFTVRAGCYGAKPMLEHFAEHVQREAQTIGGRVQSLEESSFDAWIGLYKQSPDTPNSQTNYYLKGLLVAWKLDLLLRESTEGDRSLDDVMRHLWQNYGRVGRGVGEGAMASIVREATGVDVETFLDEHVRRPGALDLSGSLASIGLQLRQKPTKDDERPSWIGATFETAEEGTRLKTVDLTGPAHAGGLMAGDLLIAIDGHRVGAELETMLETHRPGDVVTWTAFRADRLVEGRLTFGDDPVGALEIVAADDATDAQRRAFEAWSGVPFDSLTEGA
jgi:predicted metalloprotease with PDZ domain